MPEFKNESIENIFVIKPKAIHVAQSFEIKFAKNKKSPFDDNYDLFKEGAALGDKANLSLKENDPDFAKWEIFRVHQLLLLSHIKKKTGRTLNLKFGEYAVVVSEDERFDRMGSLNNRTEDAILLHTKQAVRMWEGNNDKEQRRWAGVRFGLYLINEVTKYASQDNPFAIQMLLKFEKEVSNVHSYFQLGIDLVSEILTKLSNEGIKIGMITNESPLNMKVGYLRLYGFKLVELLIQYDLFVRAIKTIAMKGMTPNQEANKTLYNGAREFRKILQKLYERTTTLRAIKGFDRSAFLENATLSKIKMAVAENILPKLHEEVLRYEVSPSLLFLKETLNPEKVEAIVNSVRDAGILINKEVEDQD